MRGLSSDTERLLKRAATGDTVAVDELMSRHRNRLRQMVAVRMDSRLAKRVDPSDVVQETLTEAFRKLPEYLKRRPIPFYPWLREIAWNRLVDLYRFHIEGRRRAVDREVPLGMSFSDESLAGLAGRLVASGTSPSGHLQRKELRDRARAALAKLPEHYREVLVMRHLEQLSIKEISVVVGVKEGTVKSRLFRGMEQLHYLLGDQLGDDL